MLKRREGEGSTNRERDRVRDRERERGEEGYDLLRITNWTKAKGEASYLCSLDVCMYMCVYDVCMYVCMYDASSFNCRGNLITNLEIHTRIRTIIAFRYYMIYDIYVRI